MEETRTRVEKHIEVEEDHADRLEAERQSGARDMRLAPQGGPRGEVKYPPKPRDYPLTLTPLPYVRKEHRYCDLWPFDEDCRTLQEQIERMIQEGHLGQYVRRGKEKASVSPRLARKWVEESHLEKPVAMLNKRKEGRKEANHPREGTLGLERPNNSEKGQHNPYSGNHLQREGHETCKKLGLQPTDLEACIGKVYGFAGEQVTIKSVIELETTFGERTNARTIPLLYTVVNVDASYNIIMGRLALNKLGVIVSTLHLCMKYPVGQELTTESLGGAVKIA
ncbi:hypothetical protein CR513_47966, partial [Mucuna pruriens]